MSRGGVAALLLGGCAATGGGASDDGCDPRALEPGEVRARRVPCSDELVGGGEGRTGDWLLENAHARYVVRGTYAALTELDEEGGTLVDAAVPGGVDLLAELRLDGDRSSIEAVNGDGWAELVLPGLTWRLDADGDGLSVAGAGTGRLLGVAGVERTGATLSDGSAFFGVDGFAGDEGGAVSLTGVGRVALSTAGLFPDGEAAEGEADADTVFVERQGVALMRLPVTDGGWEAVLPAGATLVGERDGCEYDGLLRVACGTVRLRVADDAGEDLRAQVTDGSEVWTVPEGGGSVPVGPSARGVWIWAGPAYTAAYVALPGGDTSRDVTLHREMDTEGRVLASFAEEGAPDADVPDSPADLAHRRASEGVGFVAVLADDEVPEVWTDPHDEVLAVAASRAGGWLWSWPWSRNGKKAAHGAVPWQGFGALDQLTLSEGGEGYARRLVVTAAWVEAALAEGSPSAWEPRPDAVWLDGPDDLGAYFALLDRWVDVAPVGERTWVEIVGALNVPAVEAGVIDGRTTAGTGPRLALDVARAADPGTLVVTVAVEAPRWARMRTLTLYGPGGRALGAGEGPFRVPVGTEWVVAVAEGEQARPWGGGAAWAVSAPLWLASPDG